MSDEAENMSERVLPDRPSELLLLALADLEQIERDPRYAVDMGEWHRPNRVCSVCLAGAVMASTLATPPYAHAVPEDFDRAIYLKLRALDDLRRGNFSAALGWLNVWIPDRLPLTYQNEYTDYSYHKDRDEWWLHMSSIVGILQAENL